MENVSPFYMAIWGIYVKIQGGMFLMLSVSTNLTRNVKTTTSKPLPRLLVTLTSGFLNGQELQEREGHQTEIDRKYVI